MHTALDNQGHIRESFQHFRLSQASTMLKSIQRSCLYYVCNQRYERTNTSVLTFIFKVNHQGHVTYFRFSEILDIANVRIDTKIKSAAGRQPEKRIVRHTMNMCDLDF